MPPIYDQWAQCYDLSEGNRAVFIDFYSSMIRANTRSLIEFGCGTGVITSALGRRLADQHGGYDAVRVTGLDESEEMLRMARQRDGRIEWVHGNFCAPPVTGEYDLVICPFN